LVSIIPNACCIVCSSLACGLEAIRLEGLEAIKLEGLEAGKLEG
jgi:hypothetical protein